MRILFLAPQPFYVERGTPIAVRLAVDSLCRAGHTVDLLAYHEGEDWTTPGMTLHRIARPPGVSKVPIGFSPKKLICDAWMMAAALKLSLKNRYDVIHAVEEAVFISLVIRLFRRHRTVYDMDSLMVDQIIEKWPAAAPLHGALSIFERFALKRSDLVLAVCPAIADRAAESAAPGRVHLTPDIAFAPEPSTEAPERLAELFDEARPLALYVGNLEAYQGVGLLVDAMRSLDPDTAPNLAVIGGGPAAVAALQQSLSPALARRIRLLGQRPLGLLQAYLTQADILCSPRLKGVNTPMKIYSYMASGRAILATDILSHSQVLDAGCAMMVAPTAEAMAGGLAALAGDPALRARLGAAAAQRAGDVYSREAFDRRLRAAYDTLALPRAA